MIQILTITILTSCTVFGVFGQHENSVVDAPLGLRVKKNGQDYLIYADQNLNPNFKDYRKVNYQVYFRKEDYSREGSDEKKYQLITIPGSSNEIHFQQNK